MPRTPSQYLPSRRLPGVRNDKGLFPINITRATQTISSGTYADITNATATITWTSGLCAVICTVSGYQSDTSTWGNVYEYRLTDGSGTALAGGTKWLQPINPIQEHFTVTFLDLVELPRGTYTVKLQWRHAVGTGGILKTDSNDIAQVLLLPQT